MKKVLVIVSNNGTKHQIGIEKTVTEVINEVVSCKSDFYQVCDTCAIRKDEIASVEQFEYNPEEVNND